MYEKLEIDWVCGVRRDRNRKRGGGRTRGENRDGYL